MFVITVNNDISECSAYGPFETAEEADKILDEIPEELFNNGDYFFNIEKIQSKDDFLERFSKESEDPDESQYPEFNDTINTVNSLDKSSDKQVEVEIDLGENLTKDEIVNKVPKDLVEKMHEITGENLIGFYFPEDGGVPIVLDGIKASDFGVPEDN